MPGGSARRLHAVGDDDTFDPFEPDGHSVEKFYVGSGGREHGESKNVRMPTWTIGQLGKIMSQQLVPHYRTEADFWRDASVHRLYDLAEMIKEDKFRRIIDRRAALLKVSDLKTEMQEYTQLLQDYEEMMQTAVEIGDTGILQDAISNAQDQSLTLRPNYRAKLDELIARYKEALRSMDQTKMQD